MHRLFRRHLAGALGRLRRRDGASGVARPGYRAVAPYIGRWSFEDHEGVPHECVENLMFLVKELP